MLTGFIPQNCEIHDGLTLGNGNDGILEITEPSPHDVIFSMNRPVEAGIYKP